MKHTYVSGNSGRSVGVTSSTSGSSHTTTTQRTERSVKLTLTDFNYQQHSTAKTLTWSFDVKAKKFK